MGRQWSRMALAAVALALAAFGPQPLAAAAIPVPEDERLIGWRGESYRPGAAAASKVANDDGRRWIETISWRPRAYVFHNFLTEAEADHVVRLVSSTVSRSHVVDVDTGISKLDPIRTSWGGSLMRGQDAVISAIEQRIAEWTHLPPDHGEPIQVLRYTDGQKYDAHWDWFDDPIHNQRNTSDNRAATVLMYLGDVSEGGETALPIAVPIDAKRQGNKEGLSKCGANGTLAVVPKKGTALLFFDMLPDGRTICRRSLHASCPTLKGTKWTATKWIHNRPYIAGYDPLKIAARCADALPDCPTLAAAGACDGPKAAEMVGLAGQCRRSCSDCVDCPDHDVVCLRRNMRSLRAARRPRAGAT